MFYKHEMVGLKECPYLERWVFDFWFFTVRIHNWLHSDDQRYPHDHDWWYLTYVLKGSYLDRSNSGDKVMKAGTVHFRPAHHQHMVKVLEDPTITVLVTGRKKRQAGFWVNGKFKKRNRYFYDFKHHPCE